MRASTRLTPIQVVILYCVGSCVWIVLTGYLVSLLSLSAAAATQAEIAKGLVYVGASASLIYLILHRLQCTNANLEAMVSSRTCELAKSAAELREAEERLSRILANIPDVTWTSSAEGETSYISSNVARVYGFTAEEIYRDSRELWLGRIHPGDRERVITALQQLFEQGHPFDVEYRIQHKDGHWIWLHDRAYRIHHQDGVQRADGIFSDITAKKFAEQALRKSEVKFATAFQITPLGLTISTLDDGRYLEVNDAFLSLMKRDRTEVIGKTAVEIGYWAESTPRGEMVEELQETGHVHKRVIKLRIATGDIRDAEFSAELIELDGQQCVLGITQDVSDQRRLEEQFRQAQKMEAVGQLAGGVAHDFNNMLMVISSYAELIENATEGQPNLTRLAIGIRDATQSAANITNQLLAFSRKQVMNFRVQNLNAVVHDTGKMLRRLIGENIEIEYALKSELPSIRADHGQMMQALINLCVNSKDAMPGGGKLLIETDVTDFDNDFIDQHPQA